MNSESNYEVKRYSFLFDSLFDDFFVMLTKLFKLEDIWKLGIKEHVVSLMKLLHMKEECIIPSLLILEKYSSKFDHYSGDMKQFVGLGLLIGWKLLNGIGRNEEFCQGIRGSQALLLIQNSGKKSAKEMEIDFLKCLQFDVSIPTSEFLRISDKLFVLNELLVSSKSQIYDEDSAEAMEAISREQSKIYQDIYLQSHSPNSPPKPPITPQTSLSSNILDNTTPAPTIQIKNMQCERDTDDTFNIEVDEVFGRRNESFGKIDGKGKASGTFLEQVDQV